MQQRLAQHGSNFQPIGSPDIHNKLPLGNYLVCYDQAKDQFWLEQKEPFKLPGKVYGSTEITKR